MSKKITPVDKYGLRNDILQIPGVWVCGKGLCVPVEAVNNTIDDMKPLTRQQLKDYILREAERELADDEDVIKDLNKLLQYDDVRIYLGMDPTGIEEYLEVSMNEEKEADDDV